MIRLFAALSLPSDLTARLAVLQSGLSGWRLSPERNMHVTLAFFGEIDQRRAEDVDTALRGITSPGFDLWLDGVDVFGGTKPRIAYATVRPDPDLNKLRDKVRQAGRAAGLELTSERYVPHVTLARGGARADQRLTRWLESGSAFLAGPVPIGSFQLYRSDLGRGGPTYTELVSYDLTTQ